MSIRRCRQELVINDQSDDLLFTPLDFYRQNSSSEWFFFPLFHREFHSSIRLPIFSVCAVAPSSAIIVSYDQVLSNSQNNSLIWFNYFLSLSSLINIASNFPAETYTCFLWNFYLIISIPCLTLHVLPLYNIAKFFLSFEFCHWQDSFKSSNISIVYLDWRYAYYRQYWKLCM